MEINVLQNTFLCRIYAVITFMANDVGDFGPWSQWAPCSQSCFGGSRIRQRVNPCSNQAEVTHRILGAIRKPNLK